MADGLVDSGSSVTGFPIARLGNVNCLTCGGISHVCGCDLDIILNGRRVLSVR